MYTAQLNAGFEFPAPHLFSLYSTMIFLSNELSIYIFSHLPYSSLLRASATCRDWRAIIFGDLSLSRKIYKKATDPEEITSSDMFSVFHPRFHPVISRLTYCIGGVLDNVELVSNGSGVRLVDLEVSQDFACIPTMTVIHGSISPNPKRRDTLPWSWTMTFTATNPDGVRIVDIFSAIVLASTKKYDMLSLLSNGIMSQRLHSYQAPALFTKAEILGESKYFAGFSNISGSAGSASVVVETETSAASALALRKIDF